MAQLRFPLFLDLNGKRAVVIGGGAVGLRRARVLRDFGAQVVVISPEFAEPLPGVVRLVRRYRPGDLQGAFLAVAAANDRETNRAVGAEAKALGILFNAADCQEECGFFFPAICTCGSLVAGLAGDGGNHKKTAEAARRVRQVLEELE